MLPKALQYLANHALMIVPSGAAIPTPGATKSSPALLERGQRLIIALQVTK
jgi:hypothetical protein